MATPAASAATEQRTPLLGISGLPSFPSIVDRVPLPNLQNVSIPNAAQVSAAADAATALPGVDNVDAVSDEKADDLWHVAKVFFSLDGVGGSASAPAAAAETKETAPPAAAAASGAQASNSSVLGWLPFMSSNASSTQAETKDTTTVRATAPPAAAPSRAATPAAAVTAAPAASQPAPKPSTEPLLRGPVPPPPVRVPSTLRPSRPATPGPAPAPAPEPAATAEQPAQGPLAALSGLFAFTPAAQALTEEPAVEERKAAAPAPAPAPSVFGDSTLSWLTARAQTSAATQPQQQPPAAAPAATTAPKREATKPVPSPAPAPAAPARAPVPAPAAPPPVRKPRQPWQPAAPTSSYWRTVEPLTNGGVAPGPGGRDDMQMLATAALAMAMALLSLWILSATVASAIDGIGFAFADVVAMLLDACGNAIALVAGLLGDALALVWALLGAPWSVLFRAFGAVSQPRRAHSWGSSARSAYQFPPQAAFRPNSAAATIVYPPAASAVAPYFPPAAATRYPVTGHRDGASVSGEAAMQHRRAELFQKGRCGSTRPDVELCDALKQRRWAGSKDAFERPPKYGMPVNGVPESLYAGAGGSGGAPFVSASQSWCAAPGPQQCGAAPAPAPQQCAPPKTAAPTPAPVPPASSTTEEDSFSQCVAEVEQTFAPKLEAARKQTERAQRNAAKPSLLQRLSRWVNGKPATSAGFSFEGSASSLVVPGTLTAGADGGACMAARGRNNATLVALRVAQAELQSAVSAATDAHSSCHAMLQKDAKAAGGAAHVACVQKADALSAVAEGHSSTVETLAKEAAVKLQSVVLMCGGSA